MKIGDAKRILAHAATQFGGVEPLAKELGISERVLRYCIEGRETVPEGLLLSAMDLLAKRSPGQ